MVTTVAIEIWCFQMQASSLWPTIPQGSLLSQWNIYYWSTLLHHTVTLVFFLMTSLNFMTTLLKSPPKLTEYLEWLINLLNISAPLYMLMQLFSTLVQPILGYSNTTWGPYYTLDMRKIEKVPPTIAWQILHQQVDTIIHTIPPV